MELVTRRAGNGIPEEHHPYDTCKGKRMWTDLSLRNKPLCMVASGLH